LLTIKNLLNLLVHNLIVEFQLIISDFCIRNKRNKKPYFENFIQLNIISTQIKKSSIINPYYFNL